MGVILPPSLDTEVVVVESLGPALSALVRNQQIILVNAVMSIARVTGEMPQTVLARTLSECDVDEEFWAREPKIERVSAEQQIVIARP